MTRGSWGTRALACFAALLVCVTSCGKTRRNNAGQVQVEPCDNDGDCASGVCLDAGVCQTPPLTGNIFVSEIRMQGPDKLDVLLVVDNSISMADKQALFRDAVPALVRGLVDPPIVDGGPALRPVADIHFGVISSSLGGHGADMCSPSDPAGNPEKDDKGHLIATLRGLSSYQGLGFLAWDPHLEKGGETDATALVARLQEQITATGERGCGFEATLEAWYRFLVDPTPPLDVVMSGSEAVPQGIDEVLLVQRRAFLRPDSLVAIILLTDENDCSIVDRGIGWLAAQGLTSQQTPFQLPRSTRPCASDPNSPCCMSCATTSPNPDCAALPTLEAIRADPGCQPLTHDAESDPLGLRCWEQKRRFGVDFLYPTQRYVDALRLTTVTDRDGRQVPNPVFSDLSGGTTLPRDPHMIYLAGIVGVPWQDIASADTLNDPARLKYMTASELAASGRWDVILGDVYQYRRPTDPLMIEQPDPRTGVHPITNAALASPTSTNPQENPINGHEYNIPRQDDLQYACIFPLASGRCCDPSCGTLSTGACECRLVDAAMNKPLCQPPGGGPAGVTQYWAKAYPGLRHLQVLKDFGDNAIVASVCPKITVPGSPDSGYNPAVAAVLERLKEGFAPRCLPRTLQVDADRTSSSFGMVPCDIIEASAAPLACSQPARSDVDAKDPLIAAVQLKLRELGQCDGPGQPSCSNFSLCEINQLSGTALQSCQAGAATEGGFCYVDQSINPELVSQCRASERQLLVFVGENVPAKGSIVLIACQGTTL